MQTVTRGHWPFFKGMGHEIEILTTLNIGWAQLVSTDSELESFLTPSLPQPVKFPGWKMHGRACKQYIFRSCNIYFQFCEFWWRSFHMHVRKRRQKGLRVANFALLWVVFKWPHGSEGVNDLGHDRSREQRRGGVGISAQSVQPYNCFSGTEFRDYPPWH